MNQTLNFNGYMVLSLGMSAAMSVFMFISAATAGKKKRKKVHFFSKIQLII